MATENTPLLNTIAEDGPLSDFAAATVLLQLIDCVERRESYSPLLPEHVLLRQNSNIVLADAGARSPLPPSAPRTRLRSAHAFCCRRQRGPGDIAGLGLRCA